MARISKIGVRDGQLATSPKEGFDNTKLKEKLPNYAKAECEIVYPANSDTHGRAMIVFGRDRSDKITSGYGGRGHTRAGAIDIVVGLQGWSPADKGELDPRTGYWKGGEADKNFGSLSYDKPGDAARIYISQRANIDQYFDLCEGAVGNSIADSAIGMKADSIRIMARKGIKLVTGKNPPGRNSIGGKIRTIYGIDLIAGNTDSRTGRKDPNAPKNPPPPENLQPIPKGDSLINALTWMVDRIEGLNQLLSAHLFSQQLVINGLVLDPSPVTTPVGPGSKTGVTPVVAIPHKSYMEKSARHMADLRKQDKAIKLFKQEYLERGGPHYINSYYNRTN